MRWLYRRSRRPDSDWADPGFLGAGHYPIPVLEETLGLASAYKVIFDKDLSEIHRLVELTFGSMQMPNAEVAREAVSEIKAQQFREIGEWLGDAGRTASGEAV